MKRKRVCIYAKDVCVLTGRSERHAYKLLQDIRFVLNKKKHQYITTEEFAAYSGIDLNLVLKICSEN